MKLRDVHSYIDNVDRFRTITYRGRYYIAPCDGVGPMRHGIDYDEDGVYHPGYWCDSINAPSNYISTEAWPLDTVLEDPGYLAPLCGTETAAIIRPVYLFWTGFEITSEILAMSDDDLWLYIASHEPDEETEQAEIIRELTLTGAELREWETEKEDRFGLMHAMHTIMTHCNHEGAYERWIWDVPDGATDEDLRDIAEDPEYFDSVCRLFTRLVERYGADGYCSGDDLFGNRI